MYPAPAPFPAQCTLRSGCRPPAGAAQRRTRRSIGARSLARSFSNSPISIIIKYATEMHQKLYNIGAAPQVVLGAFDHRACLSQLHVAARVTQRAHKVHNILPRGVDVGRSEDWARLSRFLQCPQGLPGIGLVEEPVAVAGERLSVQTAKIVESQKAASFDGYPHVLSIDFR